MDWQTIMEELRRQQRRQASVKTWTLAEQLAYSERQMRRHLVRMERQGLVERIGERGGWRLSPWEQRTVQQALPLW